MLCSFNTHITSVKDLKRISIKDILLDIRSGKYKEQILKLQKLDKSNEDFKAIKNNLPYFVPALFKENIRKKENLEETQFILFDIDEKQFSDAKKSILHLLDDLKKDSNVFSAFVSPSSKGLKVLFKLDAVVTNPIEYENLYLFYADDFKIKYNIDVDRKCKDVSHSCFVSFDSDLFLNEKSEELKTDIQDEDELIYAGVKNDLMDNKNVLYEDGNKQNFLVSLAGACNRFGANKEIIIKRAYDDFSKVTGVKSVSYGDFENIISRVYRTYSSQFNTIKYARNNKNRNFKNIDIVGEYWNSSNNKIEINREKFISYLQNNGFCKMYLNKSYIFLRIKNNIISEVSAALIKDFVLENSRNISVDGLREQILKQNNTLFNDNFLSSLKAIKPEVKIDSKNYAYIYFKNCWIKVTKNGLEKNSYDNFEGLIWERQINKYKFDENKIKGDFEIFINNVCRNNEERIISLKSSIGYLLHSFKNSSNAKAIIYLDEKIGEGSFGRCGKSLIGKAVGKLKNCIEEDGRNFKFGGNFAFQKINFDTQNYFINDAGKDFQFERLFAMITDGMSIEKKNKEAFTIPFETSPKILITTNHVVKETDYSTIDRKFEVEFSDYYNTNHKPINDFGKLFFDDWDEEEWNKFFTFMIGCIQLFLEKGLVKSSFVNLELKRITETTSSEFIDYVKVEIELNREYNKKILFENYLSIYSDTDNIKQKTFTTWIQIYAKYRNLKYTPRRSGNDLFFTLSNKL